MLSELSDAGDFGRSARRARRLRNRARAPRNALNFAPLEVTAGRGKSCAEVVEPMRNRPWGVLEDAAHAPRGASAATKSSAGAPRSTAQALW
eukprot:14633356-Alexandrium_andersonii.AAC.1